MSIVIREYSHNFSVKATTRPLANILNKFHRWFDEYELVEMGGVWEKAYKQSFSYPQADVEEISWNDVGLEYRFHINSLPFLKQLLGKEGVKAEDIKHEVEPIYEPVKVTFSIKPEFKPFPEQEPIIPQMKELTPVSKLLPLQTGGGKSYLSLVAAHHWGYRSVFFMKPGYIDKWEGDINKTLNIAPDKIVKVMGDSKTGGIDLLTFLKSLDAGWIEPEIVLVSNASFRNWIAEQEKMPPGELVPGYPCFPWEFMQHCGFGFRVIDEVHQDYHANFRFDLITHVEQSLSLSATLVTRSEYLKKMYDLAYPAKAWLAVPAYRKYMRGMSYHFEFYQPDRIKTTARGRSSYSHVEFEKSIMRSSRLLKDYYMMIYDVMRKTYLFERQDPQRCLVYFSTRQMCEDAVFFFRQLLPHLKVNKFNQGDPLKNITESDVCFATLGKAGTAIDIPFLTTVIQTVANDSIQAIQQAAGRLRDLLRLYKLDRVPLFVWFVCENLDKHKRYHRGKIELLGPKMVSTNKMFHTMQLGYNHK